MSPDDQHPLPEGKVEIIRGRSVHWAEIAGPDAPVLLLGGCGVPYTLWTKAIATSDGATSDAASSDGTADRLRGHVVLLDRPGMAGSHWPGTLPTLDEEVDTLVAVIERIGRPSVVVGHSMGGPHAEALARIRPDLVRGLVLVDASMSWRPRPSRFEQGWLLAAKAVQATMRIPPAQALAVAADKAMVSLQSVRTQVALMPPWAYRDPEAVAMVIAEQAAYGRQLSDLGDLRAGHAWPGVPTIVLTATGDGGSGWEADQARYAELLGAEQRVLPDSRHLIMLDRPDAVVAAVSQLRR